MGQQSRTTGSGKEDKGGENRRARKNERLEATRARVAAAREAERKSQRRRKTLVIAGSVVGVLAVAGALTAVVATSGGSGSSSGTDVVTAKLDTSKKSPIQGVQVYDPPSRNHIPSGETIKYTNVPPVGGDHDPVWLNCGVYTSPVPERNAVHAMEHGSVWITYQPNLPADQLAKLQALVRGKTYMVLSPFPGLTSPITATAWGLQLPLTSADDPRLAQFVDMYREGPQTPEPGAPCTGGVGTPS